MKIIDAHTHIQLERAFWQQSDNPKASTVDGMFNPIYDLAKRLNYEKFTVLSLQCIGDMLQNLLCALCKITNPGKTYAFGGFDYTTGRDVLSQAKNLREMGFDGIKMLEGKPTTRKTLKRALCDPMYDDYYSYMEETGFPILFHVADPGTFWDKSKVPDWAIEQGWYYDETNVPYNQYYEEVETMLNKHPKLKAIFAHFFFLSPEPERAQKFLDDHPNYPDFL